MARYRMTPRIRKVVMEVRRELRERAEDDPVRPLLLTILRTILETFDEERPVGDERF